MEEIPPGMYKTLSIMEYLLYQLVQDFYHQQYCAIIKPPSWSPKMVTIWHPKLGFFRFLQDYCTPKIMIEWKISPHFGGMYQLQTSIVYQIKISEAMCVGDLG